MRHAGYKVKLLYRDGVYLVHNVNAGYVDAVAFDNVDEVVGGGVLADHYVGVVDLVLGKNGFHTRVGCAREREGERERRREKKRGREGDREIGR